METAIKSALGTRTLKKTGHIFYGFVNEGEPYRTDDGIVYMKRNSKPGARLMFDGELESLKALMATNTIRVPKPIQVFDNRTDGGAALVMEYLKISSINRHSAMLGEQLARLHLHNTRELSIDGCGGGGGRVDNFGFDCTTCCGFLPQDNTWCHDWVTFLTEKRLQVHMDKIAKAEEPELHNCWEQLKPIIPYFFEGIDVKPSLVHGDLHSGNVAETSKEAVIFDPASFYGHAEYDLAISQIFGQPFNSHFYEAYQKKIPREAGFLERQNLYQLYHYLNYWNHFGDTHRSAVLSIMKKLIEFH